MSMVAKELDFQEYNQLSQKVADAIEAVLRVDVTIINGEMRRIAGTGSYRNNIGENIGPKTVFDHCVKNNDYCIIRNARNEEICFSCPRFETCIEKAEICVPIRHQGKAVGVIGIIAFTEEKKISMLANEKIYLNFIQKMASLLEAKYAEIAVTRENKLLTQRINTIINSIDEGLIVFDKSGEVLYYNKTLDKFLKEAGIEEREGFIESIKKQLNLPEQFKSENTNGPIEIVVNHKGEQLHFLASFSSLKMSDNSGKELIIMLQSLRKLQKKVIQSAEKNQVQIHLRDIIGCSPKFVNVKRLADKAARSDSSILICGESGTGKELFARAIHSRSDRNDQPFVPINCGAIPDELLESELFGHEKGAFTGAHAIKYGKFEVADNGTIFLDEISEMPFHLQVKLLRVLQEREVCRIGSNKIRKINIRVIAATNTNLIKRIESGLFRKDLYYRLNIIPLQIPPLRERRDDIICIGDYFLKYYNRLLGKNIIGFSEEVKKIFLKYDWPGNVRELQNVIEYAINFETEPVISRECIEKRLNINDISSKVYVDKINDGFSSVTLDSYLKMTEKKVISDKINDYQTDSDLVYKICDELNISKATFYRKVKEHSISIKK